MADVELVIKIPEGIMEYIKNNGCLSVIYNNEIANAIVNGTPLPKGHGRLIDADATKCSNCGKFGCENSELCLLYNASTIIEADTESEDKA